MDIVKAYSTLSEGNDGKSLMGAELPKLWAGYLTVDTKDIPVGELLENLNSFSAECGWIQYRDQLTTLTTKEALKKLKRTDLLEAQLRRSNVSLHVKFLGDDLYRVVLFEPDDSIKTGGFVYTEQPYYMRQDLVNDDRPNGVLYRLWWQDKSDEGDWHPFAQQFLGFIELNEAQGGQ